MRLAFWGPDIDEMRATGDLPGLVRAWPKADDAGRDKIREGLKSWTSSGDIAVGEYSARALVSLGFLRDLVDLVAEEEFDTGSGRICTILPIILDEAVRLGDADLAKYLIMNVKRWDVEALIHSWRWEEPPVLTATVAFLGERCGPACLMEIALKARCHFSSEAAEKILQETGGQQALEFYRQVADHGLYGMLGTTLDGYVEEHRSEYVLRMNLHMNTWESEFRSRKAQLKQLLDQEDMKRKRLARKVADQLSRGKGRCWPILRTLHDSPNTL